VSPLPASFYARDVVEVAHQLIGCHLRHGASSGIIVETEAYHDSEPACHAFVGLTRRTATLFGAPGRAYVYRSYGIHALLNAVCEPAGTGAAVLIRALEPLDGIELMARRRGLAQTELRALCSGPGKLTQALAVGLELNGSSLIDGPVVIDPPPPGRKPPRIQAAPRIGISKATELPWRFCAADSPYLSAPVRLRARSTAKPGAA
jgi:DNA-3-methyladenine glycosylase